MTTTLGRGSRAIDDRFMGSIHLADTRPEKAVGEGVFKIGMTRRLDPMNRVRELGDASVPFQFDVHAIIYSDDAPALETKLHRAFHQRRVNRMNERKEFFKVGIDEIAEAVRSFHGEIEVVRDAEAVDFRKTLAAIEACYTAPAEGSSQPVPAADTALNLPPAAEVVAADELTERGAL